MSTHYNDEVLFIFAPVLVEFIKSYTDQKKSAMYKDSLQVGLVMDSDGTTSNRECLPPLPSGVFTEELHAWATYSWGSLRPLLRVNRQFNYYKTSGITPIIKAHIRHSVQVQ